jgi:hypothetical protein
VDEFEQTRIPFIEGVKNNIDANSINNSGVYSIGTPGNNFPENFIGGILVVLKSTHSIQITFNTNDSSYKLFFRWKFGSNGNWLNWCRIKSD